jgi:hypothetical protein
VGEEFLVFVPRDPSYFDDMKEDALMSRPFKLFSILLMVGFFSATIMCWNCQAQDVFPRPGPGVTPPSPSPVVNPPQQSPDRQRFRPETPGNLIKSNREKVQEYQSVPPPEVPSEATPKKTGETVVK